MMAQGGGGANMSGMGDGPAPTRPATQFAPDSKAEMMRPSEYKREMCMTTADRHRAFSDKRELDRLYAGRRPYKAFTVIPHRVVFQQFGRCATQEQQVIFRNDDCIPHLLRVMPSLSPYVSVALVSAQGGKLAPGMYVAYRVTFRPEDQCDYYYELQCTSDQVSFAVPVIAIGPRAILDFPDRIIFQNQPVHAETSKLLSVKNVGQKAAKFSLDVAKPFVAEPRCGTLPVGEVAQVTFRYLPTTTGPHCEYALLTYDNGEKVVMEIHGTGVEVDIGLSSYTTRMDTTFIGLTSRKTLRLYNKSATPATFVWRCLETEQPPPATQTQSSGLPSDPSLVASLTAGARVPLPPSRPDSDAVSEEPFAHPIYSIEPLRGEVWPDSAVEVTVIFQPDSEGEADCIAYCQVTGRASRLPLRLSGRGRGADVQLSLDSLDIGAVFKNSVFNYEVIAVNRGDIPATLRPLAGRSPWARHITFHPAEMELHPKDHHTLVLTLDAQILGRLDETFSVQVSGASRPLSLHLRGRVVPPTLEFDSALLDFGLVPFGFRRVLRCRLKNTSLVPVEFSLCVPEDGGEPAVRQERLAAHLFQVVKKGLSEHPKEFTLKPSKGILQPQSSVNVKVELVPNRARQTAARLLVAMDGVQEALYAVPVTAECQAAEVQLRSPDVLLGRHFKGCSAAGAVTLVNPSAVPARYFLLPQESMDFPGVTYTCEEPTGIIEAHSTATVPFTVKLEALGSLVVPIRVAVFGRPEPLQVTVHVVSQGPVIDIQPARLDWGVIPVLSPQQRTVTISNQAPIPATLTAAMQRSSNYWLIEPSEATVAPQKTLSMKLTAVLDDPLRFLDVLTVNVQDSGTWEIPVTAQGTGSSILFQPPLGKVVLDLGPVFCKSPVNKVYSATNKGRRFHQLMWTNEGMVEQSTSSIENLGQRASSMKLGRRAPGYVPVFRVTPRRVDIQPSETQTFALEAYCETVGRRREEVLCMASVGHSSGKQVLRRLVVTADFIQPLIELSHRELFFQRKQLPGVRSTEQMIKRLTLTNSTPLTLTTHMRAQYPFMLRNLSGGLSAELDHEIGVDFTIAVDVMFDPDFEKGLTSRYIRDKLIITYEEHPHCDEVTLIGVVSFPNISVSPRHVDFGYILNDMESCRKIKIANNSKVPVLFHWYFVEEETELEWLQDASEPLTSSSAPQSATLGDDSVQAETKVSDLHLPPADTLPVECHGSEALGARAAARARRQSRYDEPPPVEERAAVALRQDQIWKRQATISELLDIYPLRGRLQPGEASAAAFRFSGRGSVRFAARAVCVVRGGPQYAVRVSGTASSVRHRLESHQIDCGGHIYCQFLEASTTLHNPGQVAFPWRLRYDPEAGRMQVSPTEGVLQAGETQRIAFHFLPMIPEAFERHVELTVAHFPPERITIRGFGAYPAVTLDLPLQYEAISEQVFLQAVQNLSALLEAERAVEQSLRLSGDSVDKLMAVQVESASDQPPVSGFIEYPQDRPSGGDQPQGEQELSVVTGAEPASAADPAQTDQTTTSQEPSSAQPQPQVDVSGDKEHQSGESALETTPHAEEEEEEQEEEERGEEAEEEVEQASPPLSPSWSVISDTDSAIVDAALIDLEVERLITVDFIRHHPTTASFLRGDASRRNAVSLDVLKYRLDFGVILLGSDIQRTVTVTNNSQLPVSVNLISSVLPTENDSELRVQLQETPGPLPPGESISLHIRLRPSLLEQAVEMLEKMIYLEVKNGLFIPVLLRATVTTPVAELEEGDLQFDTVYLGKCKVCQMKVHNNGILPCSWSLVSRLPDRPAPLPFSGGERARRAALAAAQPPVFTFQPHAGTLLPDQWAVVDVTFAPGKSKVYYMDAVLSVYGSPQSWTKRMTGEGLDPALVFSTTDVSFEPIVPYVGGSRMEVTVTNPHPIPLEIYCAEYDRQYLEEEHILRLLPGYDEFETLLLPPRIPGEPLPAEVLAYYTKLVHRASQAGRPAEDQAPTSGREALSHASLDQSVIQKSKLRLHGEGAHSPMSLADAALAAMAMRAGSAPQAAATPGPPPAAALPPPTALSVQAPALVVSSASAQNQVEEGPPSHGGPPDVPAAPDPPPPAEEARPATAGRQRLTSAVLAVMQQVHPVHSAVPPDDPGYWPGWSGVNDQPAMWTLPAQEKFIRDYQELCERTGGSAALPDPVLEARQSFLDRDRPAEYELGLSRRAPAFVIISAPYTEPYLLAVLLSELYGVTIVTLDELVWEGVLAPSSPAAHRARDYLMDTGKAGGRAPAAAKQPGNAAKRGQSTGKASSYGRHRSDSSSPQSQVPDPREALKPRHLPAPMLGELIAARLMEPDLSSGVVFWDVQACQFSSSLTSTVMALLLGLGKRRHAYFITLEKTMQQHRATMRRLSSVRESSCHAAEPAVMPDAELLQCDEQEYLELSEADRARLEQLLRRTSKQRARERREEVRRLQEQLRQEHEKKTRKGKAGGIPLHKGGSHHTKMSSGFVQSDSRKTSLKPSAVNSSVHRSDSIDTHERKKRGVGKKKGEDEVVDERALEEDKVMTAQFKAFSDLLPSIVCLLDIVDRDRLVPEGLPTEDMLKFGSSVHKKAAKAKVQPRMGKASTLSKRTLVVDESHVPTDVGVTHVLVNGSLDSKTCYQLLVETGVLPSPERVKNDMGMGPEGPPLAPYRTFSVVRRPPLRPVPEIEHPVFTFQMDEAEKIAQAEAAAEKAAQEEKAQRTPEKSPPPKRKGTRRGRGRKRSDSSLLDQRTTGSGGEETDLATAIRQALHRDDPAVSGHRWVVPAEGELTLSVLFDVNRPGRYEAALHLETVGAPRRYTLHCSGSCVLPLINRKIKTLYSRVPMRAEDSLDDHGVAFVRSTRTLNFGPLPVVKSTQRPARQQSGTGPPTVPHGHLAEVTIENISPLPVEISFYFFNDSVKVPAFQLWPMSMSLAPGEKDFLQVMAMPPSPQPFEDMIIGCVRENPDPWITKVTCVGARPEVHLDKKALLFDRVLLLRKETRKLSLTNRSLIPLLYRLMDTEQFGDGFNFRPREGTLQPMGTSEIEIDFSPIRPCLYHNKKLKLEITECVEERPAGGEEAADGASRPLNSTSDSTAQTTESPRSSRAPAVLQTEMITVSAEGFDVAVDLMFPKGLATGVDFGTIKVKEESKQSFTIKNKGKYEIVYKAWLEDPDPVVKGGRSIIQGFNISPERGVLHPHDRPLVVQMWYTTESEIEIKKKQMLRIQIVDFHRKEEGEVIALIPVPVSVRALFCRYSVTPSEELDMGFFPPAVRKTSFFVIKNDGKFDFSYHIIRALANLPIEMTKERAKKARSGKGSSASKTTSLEQAGPATALSQHRSSAIEKASKIVQEQKTQKLVAGIYTVQPAMGTIPVNSQVTVNVEAISSEQLSDAQALMIRISDAGDGVGIPFRLLGTVTAARIRDDDGDFLSLFQEYPVIDSLKDYQPGEKLTCPPGGVYGRTETRFLVRPTLVGDQTQVEFRVCNTGMVPADVIITIKQPGQTNTARSSKNAPEPVKTVKIFEVSPARATIPVHGFQPVTVTFTPVALQTYTNVLDIQVEEASGTDRSKGIVFEITGEGTLPRLDVLEPAEVTKHQEPLLSFLSTRLGDTATGSVRLRNAGNVTCMVDLFLQEGRDLFTVTPDERTLPMTVNGQETGMISNNQYVLGTVCLSAGAEAVFLVTFTPRLVGSGEGLLVASINYNAFQRQAIRLTGHGYSSGVLLRGLSTAHYVPPPPPPPPSKNQKEEPPPVYVIAQDMPQLQYSLEFVACYIGATYRKQFRMENCSESQRYRFEWHNTQLLTFSPAVGHLAPREMKTITVAFFANEAVNFEMPRPAADIPPPPKRGKAKVEPVKPEHVVTCTVTGIAYPGDGDGLPADLLQPPAGSSWDERSRTMQLVPADTTDNDDGSAEETERQTQLLPEPEPAHEELPPAPALRLDVPAVLQNDLARVRFTATEISFGGTFMFQRRQETVTLENVGLAEVRYSWTLDYVPPQARPVSAETQVNSVDLEDSHGSVGGGSGSGASFLQMMSQRIDALADYVPFTVEPSQGRIAPGQTQTFTVQFAPLDVLEYNGTLHCEIPYLFEEIAPPCLALDGQGVLPVCHMDLEGTECRDRADPSAPPGECDVRVVPIDAVGVNRKVSRSFFIINPTESSWHYSLAECEPDGGPQNAWFSCVNPTGVVNSGQRTRVTFEFFPRAEGRSESRWQFVIREHELQTDLVLVGTAREPVVYPTQAIVQLPPVLTGMTVHGELCLVNEEERPLRYQLDLDSCFSANQALRLTVQPIEGLLPARGAATLAVQYSAQAACEVEFHLRFSVETRHTPLLVCVRTEGYTLQAEATLLDPRGRDRHLSAAAPNQLDLGLIPCREMVYRAVEVTNTGKFPFTLEMEDATESPPPRTQVSLSIENREMVEPLTSTTCKFGILCSARQKFSNIKILVKATNGPCFALLVRGSAEPPNVTYSHAAIDFGPCFLYQEGMPPIVQELRIENRDRHPVSIRVDREEVPYFVINIKQAVVDPSEKLIVPIQFVPLEAKRYCQTINFIVNGQLHRAIRICGDGIRFQVEVANAEQKQIVLSDFRAGQRLQKSITVVNRADAAVRCQFQLTCGSPGLQNLTSPVLRLRPAEAELKPRASVVLELQCFSKTRLPWFQEQVRLVALGLTYTLLTVEGVCQGMDLRLDVRCLPFGAVAAYSKVSRNVCLINDGDFGARFRWPSDPLQPEFSIRPSHGYAAPKSRVVCEVSMHPRDITSVIKKEGVCCDVENYGSLPLTLTGSCVPVTAAKDPVQFTASVRSEDVRTIQIQNKTNNTWEVVPMVSGEFWRGEKSAVVPPQSTGQFPVTYRPTRMTQPGEKHAGSVFLALPDGQALLYSLLGTAEPPLPAGKISADITCKTPHVEVVDVGNWLTEPQRFVARTEVIRSEKEKTDVSTTVRLKGLEYVDVPALGTVPYTLNVFCYKEATFHVKLTFRNAESGEYQFYDITYRVTKAHERQPIELFTTVRRAVAHSVFLERPLESPLTCQVTCTMNELIQSHHGPVHFPAGQEARLPLECLPLREGRWEAPLDVQTQEMGPYLFELAVTARLSPLAGTVHLSCPLGQSVTRQLRFTNFTKTRTEYTTQLVPVSQLSEPCELAPGPETPARRPRSAAREKDEDKPKTFAELLTQAQSKGDDRELQVDKAVFGPPGWPQGVETSLDLTYEPVDVCQFERGLVLSSAVGGEYRFSVHCECTPPEPQGPFNVKTGASLVIPFKNMFPVTAQFSYYVDSPYFAIQKTPDSIRAKKDVRVTVTFDAGRGPPVELSAARPITACLTISGPTLPHGHTPAWRYYLRGLPSDK